MIGRARDRVCAVALAPILLCSDMTPPRDDYRRTGSGEGDPDGCLERSALTAAWGIKVYYTRDRTVKDREIACNLWHAPTWVGRGHAGGKIGIRWDWKQIWRPRAARDIAARICIRLSPIE